MPLMQIGRQTLEDFSRGLLALDRLLALGASPSKLMREGLALLRTLVPFDAAWWGECSGGIDGMAPNNWLSGHINLSADFAREWNRICASDRFANESMQRLGTVVSSVGYADPEPSVEAFARRHDLYHVMAITRALPGSGLLQFVSLYRYRASPDFEPAHRVLFEHFPHWNGTQLPDGLALAVRQPSAALKLGGRRLDTRRCGDLVLLSLAPQRRRALLPPREMSVALLYADGQSHKEIARETGLAPATVRTYLREAYLRLGVSDKVALSRALGGQSARRPTRTKG